MPRKSSNPEKTSTPKKKASARQNATARIAEQRGTRGKTRVPLGNKTSSQSRFPGETPLTGEDRPARKPGEKAWGQSRSGKATASGKGRLRNGPTRKTDQATGGTRRYGSPGSATRKTPR